MTTLAVENVSVFLAGRPVLSGASLRAESGTLVGLIGPNGAGKTTLLRAIAGLEATIGGRVDLGDRPMDSLDRAARARSIAYLPQGATVHWPLTVERVVALGRLPHLHAWGSYGPADRAVVQRALEAADAAAFADRPVTALSTGERARVLLARALASEPAVLLADEPVAALDPSHQLDVLELLRRRCAEGLTAVVVLHDLSLAARYCDALTLLVDGSVRQHGSPVEVLAPETLRTAYGIDGAVHETDGVRSVLVRRTLTDEASGREK